MAFASFARESPRLLSSTLARAFSKSAGVAGGLPVDVVNPGGATRVVVTKALPGTRWLDILVKKSNCRVEAGAQETTPQKRPIRD